VPEADELYPEHILDHYKHPRNKGILEPASYWARDTNPLCGDELTIYLRVDGSERISDVRFDGRACVISQASASMFTEDLRGKSVAEVVRLGREDVLRNIRVSLPTARMKCALLPLHALRRALGLSPEAPEV